MNVQDAQTCLWPQYHFAGAYLSIAIACPSHFLFQGPDSLVCLHWPQKHTAFQCVITLSACGMPPCHAA